MSRPDFEKHIAAIETYLVSCVERRDWHGVADAANELRVLEAIRDNLAPFMPPAAPGPSSS